MSFSVGKELQINQHSHPQSSHSFNGRGCRLYCLRPPDSIHGQVRFNTSFFNGVFLEWMIFIFAVAICVDKDRRTRNRTRRRASGTVAMANGWTFTFTDPEPQLPVLFRSTKPNKKIRLLSLSRLLSTSRSVCVWVWSRVLYLAPPSVFVISAITLPPPHTARPRL